MASLTQQHLLPCC